VVPKVAVAPLFLVWFGVGVLPKVLVAFLISFFPIVIDAAVGLRSMSADSLYAEQVATRVSGWSDSAAIGADLATLYRGIHDIAEGTLVASVRNETAYRDAARDMLSLLAAGRSVDQQIAELATANGLTLPEPSTAP
jgi:NitT/TauT family transport system permease protein